MKLICVKNLSTKEVTRIDASLAQTLVDSKTYVFVSKSKYKSYKKEMAQ